MRLFGCVGSRSKTSLGDVRLVPAHLGRVRQGIAPKDVILTSRPDERLSGVAFGRGGE
jgi:hypothetical protein